MQTRDRGERLEAEERERDYLSESEQVVEVSGVQNEHRRAKIVK